MFAPALAHSKHDATPPERERWRIVIDADKTSAVRVLDAWLAQNRAFAQRRDVARIKCKLEFDLLRHLKQTSIAGSPVHALVATVFRLPSRVPERLDLREPLPMIRGLDHADDRLADRPNADKFQNIALQARHAVLEKEPPIDQPRHAHGHDQACRFSLQWSCGWLRRHVAE